MSNPFYDPKDLFKSQRNKILSMYSNADEILTKSENIVEEKEEELIFEKSETEEKSEEVVQKSEVEEIKEDNVIEKSEDNNELQSSFDILSSPIK